MTWGQGHLIHLSNIPCRHNHSTGVGIVLQLIQHILYLVYRSSVVVGPRTPLVSVDGSQFSILICPLVPDSHTMFLKVFHVGIALQEPEQFVDDALQMELLRCQQRKSVLKVISRLGSEDTDGTCSCTVTFLCAFCEDTVQNV